MFEATNQSMFAILNAPEGTSDQVVFIAKIAAEWLLYLVALLMVLGWVWRGDLVRRALFNAGLAAVLGLAFNQVIRSFWEHPRPFAAGFGQQFLEHAADASFPSDHGTILFSIAFGLLLSKVGREAGGVVMLMALATAWARVFLGVHWPLDMVGSFGVGLISALLVSYVIKGPVNAGYGLGMQLYRWLIDALHLPPSIFPR